MLKDNRNYPLVYSNIWLKIKRTIFVIYPRMLDPYNFPPTKILWYVGWGTLFNNYKFKKPWTWWSNWAFHLFLVLMNLLILYFNLLEPYGKHVFESDFLNLKQKIHLIQWSDPVEGWGKRKTFLHFCVNQKTFSNLLQATIG